MKLEDNGAIFGKSASRRFCEKHILTTPCDQLCHHISMGDIRFRLDRRQLSRIDVNKQYLFGNAESKM